MGSNAELPIVGGSILSHDHYQGGRYSFAMERAEVESYVSFEGFADVEAGIVCWPMSVIRLRCKDSGRLAELADRILTAWRGYSDESVGIIASTDGEAHNTVTPIARRRGKDYEMDLVLRNNRCTEGYPLGIFHPHKELHHIKKENIGLIEVMGLAVLPPRLKDELDALEKALKNGEDLRASELTAKHADWAEELKARYDFSAVDAQKVLRQEVGQVFKQVLEQCGVFKRDKEGQAAFRRFLEGVK
jgi:UDPglucose--hexose-1-phosphate uridylyltransferase